MTRKMRYIGTAAAALALAGVAAGTANATPAQEMKPVVVDKSDVGPATVQLRGPYDDFRACVYAERAAIGAGERIHWACFQGVEGKWWFAVEF